MYGETDTWIVTRTCYTPPMPAGKEDLVSIYEATNAKRKEVYYGLTSLLAPALAAWFKATPPLRLKHWGKDRVQLKLVSYSIRPSEAAAFIAKLVDETPRAGWVVLQEP